MKAILFFIVTALLFIFALAAQGQTDSVKVKQLTEQVTQLQTALNQCSNDLFKVLKSDFNCKEVSENLTTRMQKLWQAMSADERKKYQKFFE